MLFATGRPSCCCHMDKAALAAWEVWLASMSPRLPSLSKLARRTEGDDGDDGGGSLELGSLPPEMFAEVMKQAVLKGPNDPCARVEDICRLNKVASQMCASGELYERVNAVLGWYGAGDSLKELLTSEATPPPPPATLEKVLGTTELTPRTWFHFCCRIRIALSTGSLRQWVRPDGFQSKYYWPLDSWTPALQWDEESETIVRISEDDMLDLNVISVFNEVDNPIRRYRDEYTEEKGVLFWPSEPDFWVVRVMEREVRYGQCAAEVLNIVNDIMERTFADLSELVEVNRKVNRGEETWELASSQKAFEYAKFMCPQFDSKRGFDSLKNKQKINFEKAMEAFFDNGELHYKDGEWLDIPPLKGLERAKSLVNAFLSIADTEFVGVVLSKSLDIVELIHKTSPHEVEKKEGERIIKKFEELTGAADGRRIRWVWDGWVNTNYADPMGRPPEESVSEVLGSDEDWFSHKKGRFKDIVLTLAMLPNVREKYVFDDHEQYNDSNMHCREQNCHSLGYFRLRTDDDKKHYVVHNDPDDSSDED